MLRACERGSSTLFLLEMLRRLRGSIPAERPQLPAGAAAEWPQIGPIAAVISDLAAFHLLSDPASIRIWRREL